MLGEIANLEKKLVKYLGELVSVSVTLQGEAGARQCWMYGVGR